jgi:hypothetical protein
MRKGGNYTFAARQAPGLALPERQAAQCDGQPEQKGKNEMSLPL